MHLAVTPRLLAATVGAGVAAGFLAAPSGGAIEPTAAGASQEAAATPDTERLLEPTPGAAGIGQPAGGGEDGTVAEVVAYDDLSLNLETYQAVIEGKPLDLTYMEYELLKFLAAHPGKVFTRETLLNRVWGYDYYGGARTVDVHVRRLRAKLGEEHANLIQTIRSVGYSFGRSRWM